MFFNAAARFFNLRMMNIQFCVVNSQIITLQEVVTIFCLLFVTFFCKYF